MKKKIAIIGYGGQGRWHGQQILKSDVVELAGVYDINPVRQKVASAEGIHTYFSTEELFADDHIDAVVVATPNDSHKKFVIKSLEAGKHVICEKPAAVSVEAFEAMCKASNRSGKLLTVHQNRRWDVDFLAMKQLADSKEIGDVIRVESRVYGSRGIPSDWRCTKAQGGGMLLDWGVHLIDQVLQIIDNEKICKVYCQATHITNKEVDDGFRLEIFFESGKTAYVEVGTYNFLLMPRFYMQCSQGSTKISVWHEKAHVAKLKAWNEKDVLPIQTGAGITKTMAPRDSITIDEYDIERPISDVHDFYRNFVAAIDGKEKLLVTNKEVLRVLQVIEAAFHSMQRMQVLEVEI